VEITIAGHRLSWLKIVWQERRSESIAFLCLLGLLTATAVGSYYSILVAGEQANWTEHSVQTLSAIQQAAGRYAEMESQLRAYEITQLPLFLAAYRAKQPQAIESLENLRRLTVDNSAQQFIVDELEEALHRRTASGDSVVEVLAGQEIDRPRLIQLVNSGEKDSLGFRELIRSLTAGETRLIGLRSSAHRRAYTVSGVFVVFLSLAGAAGIVISLGRALRNLRRQERDDLERDYAVVSERDALERALAAGQRTIEIFDSISDGLFVFDAGFNYLYVNPQGERITGNPKSQLIGHCLWELCPEKQATDFERVYRKVMLERAPDTFEAQFPGSNRWLEVRVFPNLFTGGLTVFFRDISELRVAREEQARLLREVCVANDLLNGVMEGSRDLITSIDAEYRFTAMNQAYRATILEMSGRDIRTGMKVTELNFKPDLQIQASNVPWTGALKGEESTAVEEFVLSGAARRMFEVHYCSIRDAAGGVVGASAIARDVTERRQAEQSLVAAHALLRAQMGQRTDELHEKETLLHEVHHRVKNNLQVISSLLSMQRNLVEDEHAREAFHQSENRILTMAMIHEFLYQQSNFSSLDLVMYLRRVADHLAASYGKEGVRCRVTGPPAVLNLKEAIPCGLIVNELVSNCFKHGFPGEARGCIDVHVSREKGHVLVSVADNGAGLPPGFDLSGKKGLGLKVVHTLATRQLHGKLAYFSGQGSRFAFEFDESAA
jgi:PAS domain S-box-containing protein